MYFGYTEIWRFTFVPVGFVLVMAASVGLALVYAVGFYRGKRSAALHTAWLGNGFVALSAADLAWAAFTGQLGAFLKAYGVAPLVELAVLAALCVGSLWFMAVAYVRSKREEAPDA